MRPHKLKMSAFGPFAQETVVDFDKMGNNIFLISGDTGIFTFTRLSPKTSQVFP